MRIKLGVPPHPSNVPLSLFGLTESTVTLPSAETLSRNRCSCPWDHKAQINCESPLKGLRWLQLRGSPSRGAQTSCEWGSFANSKAFVWGAGIWAPVDWWAPSSGCSLVSRRHLLIFWILGLFFFFNFLLFSLSRAFNRCLALQFLQLWARDTPITWFWRQGHLPSCVLWGSTQGRKSLTGCQPQDTAKATDPGAPSFCEDGLLALPSELQPEEQASQTHTCKCSGKQSFPEILQGRCSVSQVGSFHNHLRYQFLQLPPRGCPWCLALVAGGLVPGSHETMTIGETVLAGHSTQSPAQTADWNTAPSFCQRGPFACPKALAWLAV